MLSVQQAQQAANGKLLQGDPDRVIQHICIDSRQVKKNSLFVAIKGTRYDAHRFVKQAIGAGAICLVVSRKVSVPAHVSVIQVKDTTRALGLIAAFYRRQFSIPAIAITGSAGKTSTKEMVAKVLSTKYKVLKNKRSENNQYGVPLTIFRLRKSHQIMVLELGTNQKGDIRWLSRMLQPMVAIFTNIGEAHLEGLKTKRGIFQEKFSLVKDMPPSGTIIYNGDDALLSHIRTKRLQQKKISYGINHPADFTARNIQIKNEHLSFRIKRKEIRLNTFAHHSIYNALAAISCGALLKIPYNKINTNISNLKASEGRFQLIKSGNIKIIDDSYNANPLSLMSAVQTLDVLKGRGKKILVCADMLELGQRSALIHERTGKELASSELDCILTFGRWTKHIHKGLKKKGFKNEHRHFRNRSTLHRYLRRIISKGDVVLIKGSRALQMEKSVHYLKRRFE